MREKFDEDLLEIRSLIAKEAGLIKQIYKLFEDHLDNEDKEILDDIISLTDEIRKMNARIERSCMNLMALQQPVASDLRFLQMAIKYASSSNRIANYFEQMVSILENYTLRDEEKDFVRQIIDVQEEMVYEGIEGFVEKDEEVSKANIKRDDKVDSLFHDSVVYICNLIKDNKIEPEEVAEKILFFKYFERLGDRLARISNLALRQ